MLNVEAGPNGRSAGTVSWGGLFNTYYWLDPTRKVTGLIMTQVLPFADPRVLKLYGRFEASVYEGAKDGVTVISACGRQPTRRGQPCMKAARSGIGIERSMYPKVPYLAGGASSSATVNDLALMPAMPLDHVVQVRVAAQEALRAPR